jgi:site-specific recombinase XerC
VQPVATDSAREIRNRAIVVLLLGTGATAAETRGALADHLVLDHVWPHLAIPTRGARAERKLTVPSFATPALSTWLNSTQRTGDGSEPLFPAPRGKRSVNDMLPGMIVREALEAIGFRAADMSPRVLRNTYARRHLLAGRTNADMTALLGLSSQRTVVRLRATVGASQAGDSLTTET